MNFCFVSGACARHPHPHPHRTHTNHLLFFQSALKPPLRAECVIRLWIRAKGTLPSGWGKLTHKQLAENTSSFFFGGGGGGLLQSKPTKGRKKRATAKIKAFLSLHTYPLHRRTWGRTLLVLWIELISSHEK